MERADRVGHLYNHVRKQIEDLLINKAPIEAFKALVVGQQVSREMLEDCRFINGVYGAMVGGVAERAEQLKEQLEKTKAESETIRRRLRQGSSATEAVDHEPGTRHMPL